MPFRAEHLEHFQTLKSIRTPNTIRVIAWMVTLTIAAVTAFAAYTPWVQTTSGAGVVTALNPNDRQQNINALVSGRIEEWYVQDGSVVKAGDPIVKIVDNDPLLLERLRAERGQVVAKLQAAQAAMRTAQLDETRMRELFQEGLAARRDYEQAQIRVQQMRASVAEAAAELNRVDVNLSRQSVQIVEAPRAGMILSVNAGDVATVVSAGDVLATFVPERPQRVVEMYVDGRDIALVTPGAKVRLQFEGWPAVQFSGWPSVAVGTFGGEVLSIDPSAQTNGRFRVLVREDNTEIEKWPDERFIRFGAGVRGWILLETVTVGYEVWRQLNNFPPSFPVEPRSAGGASSAG
ncbi:MAG TPA: RND transporter [Hyphomonadaceae bacterium]|nr:RND transporter [Hyphomonadaceae bacterium]